MAYKIDPSDKTAIFNYLNHREKGGYDCEMIKIHFCETRKGSSSSSSGGDADDDAAAAGDVELHPVGESSEAVCWMALETNEEYLGPADVLDMARQIAHSHGPSGPN